MVALGCIAASAQELTVEKVYLDAADLSGQTRMRKDLNGEPCALVKVRLTLPGAVFSGDVVGDVFNNGGEYWVYVIDGTKHLRLNQQLVKPLTSSGPSPSAPTPSASPSPATSPAQPPSPSANPPPPLWTLH